MFKITLAAARINKGLKQGTAAEKIGVKPQTLRNWEKGNSYPKQIYIERMCKLYGVSYDMLNFLPIKLG